jgi:hypothetical protein
MEKPILYITRLLVILGIVSLACGVSIDMGNQGSVPAPAPTEEPILPSPVPSSPTPVPPDTPEPIEPTTIPSSATPEQKRFFTEEFDGGKDAWNHFLTSGDESDLNLYASNGMLVFDITGTHVYSYAVYEPEVYDDVRIDVEVANRGDNTNNVSLLCRYDARKGWYEANVFNSGLYDILFGQWKAGGDSAVYVELYSGGSNAIRTGMTTNSYSLVCDGNQISLYINDKLVRTVGSEFGLNRGQIGIGASSFKRYPVALDFDWVKISEP